MIRSYRRWAPPDAPPPIFGIRVDPLGDVLIKALPEGFAALLAPAAMLPAPLLRIPLPIPVVVPALAPEVKSTRVVIPPALDGRLKVATINPATVDVISAFFICISVLSDKTNFTSADRSSITSI
jgi:hypothetical protein